MAPTEAQSEPEPFLDPETIADWSATLGGDAPFVKTTPADAAPVAQPADAAPVAQPADAAPVAHVAPASATRLRTPPASAAADAAHAPDRAMGPEPVRAKTETGVRQALASLPVRAASSVPADSAAPGTALAKTAVGRSVAAHPTAARLAAEKVAAAKSARAKRSRQRRARASLRTVHVIGGR